MRAVKSVSIDSDRRVIITFLDGSTETLYPNLIWCDAEALKEIIKDLLEEKADAITQTIENVTIATFEDGADEALIRKLLVNIGPIQDLHGYDSPWPAGGGKNLIPPIETKTSGGLTFSQDGDYIDVTGTRTGSSYYTLFDSVIFPAGDYTVNGIQDASNSTFSFGVKIGDANYEYTTTSAHTYTSDGVTPWTVILDVYQSYDHLKLQYQLEKGTESTAWTPYSNICPISGRTELSVVRCGKNLFNPDSPDNLWVNSDGAFRHLSSVKSVTIPAKAEQILTASMSNPRTASNLLILVFFDDNGNILSRQLVASGGKVLTATAPANTASVLCSLYTYSEAGNVQLEIGSTATDYEPYEVNTYSVNWETEAGTVYGGALDVISGKLVVDHEIKSFDGSFIKHSNLTDTFYRNNSFDNATAGLTVSNLFKYSPLNITQLPLGSFTIDSSYKRLVIKTNIYSTAGELNNALQNNPLTVVYSLATPIVILLTPQEVTTLLGDNNIWADSGDILELEYVADTKLYIGESQSGTLGSGRQTISNPDLQPVSEKTVEGLTEVKAETEQKETQDERGE